ncbi:MAG: oligoendopeptidase F [Gemmatimonas sp.]|nr:oligoendopeptidase F [Gemmatimonas sp.]
MQNVRARMVFNVWIALTIVVALVAVAPAQTRARNTVPEKYKWNPADIYVDDGAWRAAKEELAARLPELARYDDRLGSAASTLADALDARQLMEQQLSRLFTYVNLLNDQDTRQPRYQGMRQEAVQLRADLASTAAFIEPEILTLDPAQLGEFIETEPRLETYRHYLDDLVRRGEHTRSDSEERLLAAVGPLASAPRSIFEVFTGSDFPYPVVTLSDGSSVRLTQAAYTELRARSIRVDRETVMSAFFEAHAAFGSTLGTLMSANVQEDLFEARARGYDSNLELALDAANIPVEVYTRLIEGVNRHLPEFHRYLELRRRMMGVEELHYYDLYAPLVPSVELTYTPEQAIELVRTAVAPLGEEYQAVVQRSFDERWADWFPTDGKRSGAYSAGGAYDVHPFVLLNFAGGYDDVSTVAHELGHAMHSYLSNRALPFAAARYPIFVAEVASTFNESLLIDHVLKSVDDPDVRLSILGNYLENIKGTLFRQAQFAEFELAMHQLAERGEPITGDALASMYLEITRKYYGHEEGVSVVDDYIAHEWSYVPHFYRDFYVYQYATSFTAAEALAQPVKAGDAEATARYLEFLSSGGADYPIELLREAGVDMTTDEPLDLAIREMVRVMDEMERLLDEGAAGGG